ncbi:unnamed protein product [Medioppia subpectinata]|uniref:C2H2-type domain-containing protein n=1 Tax=Medioppia subpectinata TaxID=1979941 RepID=A0A7R9KV73_9ACAR|nr:unnamed protein product [Medioppia subpectinata]CAG2109327.1 unnamed protein product [Medioppia subpectinata]
MSKLIELNKNELICKIQSINREKHRLKTLLSKHDLLIHLYEKLHQNCLQINGLRDGRSRQQMETKLRSTQSHLLSQIQLISKCDKSLHISLPRPPFDDLIVSQLFKEMSTQYDTNDLLCPNRAHNDIQVNPLNPLIDCNGVNGVNGFSDAIIDDKSTKCIEININETSNDGSTPIPNSTPLSDQMMAEIVSTDRCSTDAMNGMNDMISSLDTPLESKADQKKALKKYVCDYCGKRYKIEKTRDKHIISIHKYITSESMKTNDKIPNEEPIEERIEESIEEPMDEKPAIEAKSQSMLTCQWPDCGLTFTNRTHFLRHQSIHNESRKLNTN